MNNLSRCVFNLCYYIINSYISDININKIIYKNMANIEIYISPELATSDEFKYKVFQKLVLYNYCFHYQITNFNEEEVIALNNYIHDIHSQSKITIEIDMDMLNFLDWCRKYNRKNKNKINIISNKKSAVIFR